MRIAISRSDADDAAVACPVAVDHCGHDGGEAPPSNGQMTAVLLGRQEEPAGEAEVLALALTVLGRPIDLRVAVRPVRAALSDLVPLARQIADRLVAALKRRAREDGLTVPCRKGCFACCRYVVPVSMPEALRLWQEIQSLPHEHRRLAMVRFVAASRRMLAQEGEVRDWSRAGNPQVLEAMSQWYAGLELDCPLLSDGACSFYGLRPLCCREHLVVSAPAQCGLKDGQVIPIQTPVSMSESLHELAEHLSGTESPSLVLPLAPVWASIHAGPDQPTWPARELVEKFLAAIRRRAAMRNRQAAPSPPS